jgi:indolepyruvate ferredoxin oxidoreductase
VFALWYGKGPGVDRSGDVFRHANLAGTSKHGGVLALMGDDHTAESSTNAHQTEFNFVDTMIPILNPAGVQEMIDYGLHGFRHVPVCRNLGGAQMRQGQRRIDRFGGCGLERLKIILPDFDDAAGRAQHPRA